MKKRLPLILVGLLVIGAVVWRLAKHRDFLYAGTVEATRVDLSPQLTATIGQVLVNEGDRVTKGQTLLQLEGQDIRLAAEIAERDYRRGAQLHDSGTMPQETFDRLKFRRDDAALRVSWLTLVSPLEGTVMDRYHEPGELVNPQMKLLSLADLKNVWAYVYVPQPLLVRLSLGQKVNGVIPELHGQTVPGTITHIRDEAEFTPKNVQTREERTRLVYGIKISFDNTSGVLKPGMTVEVDLPEK